MTSMPASSTRLMVGTPPGGWPGSLASPGRRCPQDRRLQHRAPLVVPHVSLLRRCLGARRFGRVTTGETRRQELSGSVQCSGSFVEDRVIGLEYVGHPGGDVEGDLDVGGGGLLREADGVV